MKIDEKMISEISSMMKLEFSNEETTELVQEINSTLGMLATLQEVDTKHVAGTFYGTTRHEERFRKDEPVKNETEVEALLDNAIESENHLIKVPAILDDGEGGA